MYYYPYPYYVYPQVPYYAAPPVQQRQIEEYQDETRRFHPLPPESNRQRIDFGREPFVVDIEEATENNRNFRRALWTGQHLQVTLMSIGVGEDIGLERHQQTDQFLRIEDGEGLVEMGRNRNQLTFRRRVDSDDAIMVPAGYYHNVTNIGREPLKLYSIYAPPEHPFGTIERTKRTALETEND